MNMILLGADTHKATHTLAAINTPNAQLLDEKTIPANKTGFIALLDWARDLEDPERVWVLEDCRHLTGPLERFLIATGERVLRIPPNLTARERGAERTRGKSDPIDARAIARAALREGIDTLPTAHLDEDSLEIKLLLDHREDLVKACSQDQQRLRWHMHDLWPEYKIPAGALDRAVWLERTAGKLSRAEQNPRVRIARDLVRSIKGHVRRARELEREIHTLVRAKAPQLLALTGCGALTAAKIIAETAGIQRFSSDAKLARLAGAAPIPASSGIKHRHRLDRGGNRQLNCALHRIAVVQGRTHKPAQTYLSRKETEGKTRREALRALKRHLARTIWRALQEAQNPEPQQQTAQTQEPTNPPTKTPPAAANPASAPQPTLT
jgi:transposase